MENEIWKDIVGYEKMYQISNHGNVKSLSREITNKRGLYKSKDKILSKNIDAKGYYHVRLYHKGKGYTIKIHTLVAMAFLGFIRCNYTKVIDHVDNIRTNNYYKNLQIVTPRENASKHTRITYSKYTGVSFCIKRKKFIAYIKIKGVLKNLGSFSSEIEAHKAYQKELKKIIN